MLFGDNAKEVFNLVKEAAAAIGDADAKLLGTLRGRSGATHLIRLHEIADILIIGTDLSDEAIFEKISSIYNGRNGVRKILFFKEALEQEKKDGWCHLALVVKNKKKKKDLVM